MAASGETVKKIKVEVGTNLSGFEAGMKKAADSMTRLNGRMGVIASAAGKMGGALTAAGKNISIAFTLPLLAAGAAAFKASNDISAAYGKIAIGSGATGTAMGGLKKSFDNVVRSGVSNDLAAVGSVLADLNTRLGLTGSALETMTMKASRMSQMLGSDAAGDIRLVVRAMGDAGVAAADGSKFLDQLFVASQRTGISVQDLATTLTQYGAPLRSVGYSLEEAIALMSKFEQEGVNTVLVMSGLKMATGKLAKSGVDIKTGFKGIVSAIAGANSNMEAIGLGVEWFGDATNDMVDAIRGGRFEIDGIVASLKDSEDAINKTRAASMTFGDGFKEGMNKASLALAPLGERIGKLAAEYIPRMVGALERLTAWFEKLSPFWQKSILGAVGFTAALGPLVMGLGILFSTINAGMKTFAALRGLIIGARVALAAHTLATGVNTLAVGGNTVGLIANSRALAMTTAAAGRATLGLQLASGAAMLGAWALLAAAVAAVGYELYSIYKFGQEEKQANKDIAATDVKLNDLKKQRVITLEQKLNIVGGADKSKMRAAAKKAGYTDYGQYLGWLYSQKRAAEKAAAVKATSPVADFVAEIDDSLDTTALDWDKTLQVDGLDNAVDKLQHSANRMDEIFGEVTASDLWQKAANAVKAIASPYGVVPSFPIAPQRMPTAGGNLPFNPGAQLANDGGGTVNVIIKPSREFLADIERQTGQAVSNYIRVNVARA